MKTVRSWTDITTRQYIALYNIKEDDDFELMLKQIGIIYGLTQTEVENIPLQQFYAIKDDMVFLKEEPKMTDMKREIIIDGVKYLYKDVWGMTLGEFYDLERWNKDCVNNLHSIMAILYRKEGIDKYIPSEVDAAADLFLDNVDIQTTLSAFFLSFLLGLNYTPSDIMDCSMLDKVIMEIQNQKKEMKKELAKEKRLLKEEEKNKKKQRVN
jgi:hypothetical protein